jgi:predicted esterase
MPGSKGLDPKAGGEKVLDAKSADGLVYSWRGPRHYDAAKGVGLTVILHGSNLTHGWGFANHDKATFRPDDVVISPDGTTPNGSGGFNFMGEAKDAKRLHALLEEVKKSFKIRGTYLYGHSNGSFFAVYYAGAYPEDVDGVVAHASGIWGFSTLGNAGHHQAIVLMHGTQDPVVPYVQSEGGLKALVDAGYPLARFCSLEGWNHWPAEHNSATPHTSQELAWVEGMTTKDPERLEACLGVMADVKDKAEHDWGGLWSLAKHVEEARFAKDATKARAKKAVDVVETLAKKHAEALAGAKPGSPADGKPWMAHLPMFLRQFAGVPACEELAAKWKKTLEKHQEAGAAHFEKFWASRKKNDVVEAFDEGIATIAEGFLWSRAQERFPEGQSGPAVQVSLKAWQKDAKKLKLSKKALKDFAVVDMLESAWKKGAEAYAEVCKTAGDT